MKFKKYFDVMLTAAIIAGLSMSAVSCKDDDKDDGGSAGGGGEEQAEAQYEQQQLGWDIITQLSDERTAPDGWEQKTFEPTIGTAKDGDPYTRVVMTNDVATAASRYSDLTGADINETTVGYQFSIEGIGSLNYQRGSENDQYLAQVTVDIKQMPHLKKILYQTEQQAGLNASFSGTAYYRFGDVVRDGEGSYWICVRPSFGPEGKGDSHWISVSDRLPESNLYKYEYKGKSWAVPTGLGSNKEHMQNLAEMLFAMLKPADWLQNLNASQKPAMFHDFSTSRIKYHNIYFWQRVCNAWNEKGLFQTLFKETSDDMRSKLNGDGINMLYNGYSWYTKTSWNCSLFEAAYKNGTGNQANMHNATYTKPTKRMENLAVDFSDPDKSVNGDFFDKDNKHRFIVRYKTGKQLSATGVYDPKTRISGCDDIYVYNKYFYTDGYDLNDDPEETAEPLPYGFFAPGTVIRDSEGSRWLCYLSWLNMEGVDGGGGNQAYFISFDNIKSSSENIGGSTGTFAANDDLISEKEILPLAFALYDFAFASTLQEVEMREIWREQLGINLPDLFASRDSLYDSGISVGTSHIYSTNFVYQPLPSRDRGTQPYLRYVHDGTKVGSNRSENPQNEKYWRHFFFRRYAGQNSEYLDLVDLYKNHTDITYPVQPDIWSNCKRAGTDYRDRAFTASDCYDDTYSWTHFKYDTTAKKWPETVNENGYTRPKYVSPYWEPVLIVRHMILTDDASSFKETYNGKRYTLVHEPTEPTKISFRMNLWTTYTTTDGRTWIDGNPATMIETNNHN